MAGGAAGDAKAETRPSTNLSSFHSLIAGGISGAVSKTITAPLSRITILFQVHSLMTTKPDAPVYAPGIIPAFKKVVKKEGILAFWKGNGTSLLHRFPYSALNFHVYHSSKPVVSNFLGLQDGVETVPQRFLCGATGGLIAATLTYPIDLVRTRLASQIPEAIVYTGIWDAFYKIVKNEGLLGLYRGVSTTLFVNVPNLAISFSMYETLKDRREQVLKSRCAVTGQPWSGQLDVPSRLGFAAAAGITSALLTYPFDVVRRRMQIVGLKPQLGAKQMFLRTAVTVPTNASEHVVPEYSGMLRRTLVDLWKREGVRGLYRGLLCELLKVVPTVGLTFLTFETIKRELEERRL